MQLILVLDSSNKFIGLINKDIDPKTLATEYNDQIIEIDISEL